MKETMDYNEDKSQIVFTTGWPGEKKTCPVAVIELLEKYDLSKYEIEDLLRFHSLGKLGAVNGEPVAPKVVKIKDLVGVDLTGKLVQFFDFDGYNSGEWEESWMASTVKKVGAMYTFVNSETDPEYPFTVFFNCNHDPKLEVTIIEVPKREES
jgi:hypothetical protein